MVASFVDIISDSQKARQHGRALTERYAMKKSVIAVAAIGSISALTYRVLVYGMVGLIPPVPGAARRRHLQRLSSLHHQRTTTRHEASANLPSYLHGKSLDDIMAGTVSR